MSGNAQAFNDMITNVKMGAKLALLWILPPNTTIPWGNVIFKALTL